jgi:hypothetical protein
MGQYRIRFIKRLCNDIGVQRNCLQATIKIRRAKDATRALRAAQRRFERLKRTPDWQVYADFCELTSGSLPSRERSVVSARV